MEGIGHRFCDRIKSVVGTLYRNSFEWEHRILVGAQMSHYLIHRLRIAGSKLTGRAARGRSHVASNEFTGQLVLSAI